MGARGCFARRRLLAAGIVASSMLWLGAGAAQATTYTVNSTSALAQAITDSNGNTTQPNTIIVDAGTYALSTALPAITQDVTIQGASAQTTILDGGGTIGDGLQFSSGTSAFTVSHMTVENFTNDVISNGAGGTTLTVSDVDVHGGGLVGIYSNGANLIVSDSTISGVTGEAGIWESSGDATVTNSTIAGNNGSPGYGIEDEDKALTINGVTIAGNTYGVGPFGTSFTAENSIIADSATMDCDGHVTASDHSLDSDSTCGFTDTGSVSGSTNPGLESLQNNGGETPTMALSADSPAVDAGDDTTCPPTDQRGVSRPQSTHCDMGAYELVQSAPPSTTATTTGAADLTATGATLTGSVNPSGVATSYEFEYGTTTQYGSTDPATPQPAGSDTNGHNEVQPIGGLQPNTTYHFRIDAIYQGTDGSQTVAGDDQTFTTPMSPVATTTSASEIGPTSAALAATVNPEGQAVSYTFQLGTDTSYGTTIAGGTLSGDSVNHGAGATASGLSPSTTYHYRVTVSYLRSDGVTVTSYGGDVSFATPAQPTKPVVDGVTPNQISTLGGTSVRISGLRLATATTVTFEGAQAQIVARSDDALTVTAPSGTPGAADVTVTSPAGTGQLANAVTYIAAPFVTSVTPSSGGEGGGLEVDVNGTGFTVGTTFTVGGARATLVQLYSTTVALVTVPAGTGNAAVSASNAFGGGGTATFNYTPTCANHAAQCNGEVSADAHADERDESNSGPTAAAASASFNSFQYDEAAGNFNAQASGALYDGVATAANDSIVDAGGGADSSTSSSVTWAIQPVPTQPVEVALAYGGAANAHLSYTPTATGDCTDAYQDSGCDDANESEMFETTASAGWSVNGPYGSAYGAQSSGVSSASDQYCGFGDEGTAGFQCGDGPPHLVFAESAEHCLGDQCGPGAQAAGTMIATVSPADAERLTIQSGADAVAPTCSAPGLVGGPPGDYGRCDSTATASVDPALVVLTPGYRAVSLAGPPRSGAPALTGLSLARVDPGARVTLTGAQLGSRKGHVTLYAGGKHAGTLRVLRWSATRIVVRAPGRAVAGTVVATTAAGALSGPLPLFVSRAPLEAITSIKPVAARPGTRVTLSGFGFGRGVSVKIGGRAARVVLTRAGTITAIVPRALRPGPADVSSQAPGGPALYASTPFTVAGSVSRTLRPTAGAHIAIPGGGTLTLLEGTVAKARKVSISLEAFKGRVAVVLTLGKLLKVATLELPGRIDRASSIEALTRSSATPNPVGAPPGQLAATIFGSGVYAPSH